MGLEMQPLLDIRKEIISWQMARVLLPFVWLLIIIWSFVLNCFPLESLFGRIKLPIFLNMIVFDLLVKMRADPIAVLDLFYFAPWV